MNDEMERKWKEAVVAYFRYKPGICLDGLRETTKTLSQDSVSPGRYLNPRSPEYEAGLLTTLPRRWICGCEKHFQLLYTLNALGTRKLARSNCHYSSGDSVS
jgi:hypothetical protein